MLACTAGEDGFGAGGNRYENTDTTGETDDTQDTEDPYGDWPTPRDANGPSLGTMTAWFDEFGNIGDVIDVQIEYFDPQDDLLDGRFEVDIESEQGDVKGTAKGNIRDTTDNGADGWIEDGSLVFVISIDDEWQNYFLEISAWDKKNNESNRLEGWMGPD
jgi:hypothetical protein